MFIGVVYDDVDVLESNGGSGDRRGEAEGEVQN